MASGVESSSTCIDDIPSEFITDLYRTVGIEAGLKALPSNSKLHRAWQAAVEGVTVTTRELDEHALKNLTKLVNLTQLKFIGPSWHKGNEAACYPVWHVIVSISQYLTRLRSISLDCPYGSDALRSIAGIKSLVHRLEELKIRSVDLRLEAIDLWALISLTSLTRLCLELEGVESTELAPQDLGKQLSLLRDLEFTTGSTKEAEGSDFAIFPGSLSALTSLTFNFDDSGCGAEVEEEAACEQFLVSAVRNLAGLRRLSTNRYLPEEEAQRQALSALRQLTFLEVLRYDDVYNMGPFIMLPELPQIVTLVVPQHSVSSHVFSHPSLQEVTAGRIETAEEWRGKTATACKLHSLTVAPDNNGGNEEDEQIQFLPFLPALLSINLHMTCDPDSIHYPHTAAVLHRQASTLEKVDLYFEFGCFE